MQFFIKVSKRSAESSVQVFHGFKKKIFDKVQYEEIEMLGDLYGKNM